MKTFVLLLLVLLCHPVRAADEPATRPVDLDKTIQELGAADPTVRQNASDKLATLGSIIKPSLRDALKSDNPEIRSRASFLLQNLPWHLPTDPPRVQEILRAYGPGDPSARLKAIRELFDLDNNEGLDALSRLIFEEPNAMLRWDIVVTLRRAGDNQAVALLRQRWTDAGTSPQMAALLGFAWDLFDEDRAVAFYEKAIALDLESPQNTLAPDLARAYTRLFMIHTSHLRWEAAAELVRNQIARFPAETQPYSILQLFSLHARVGPLKDFKTDLEFYGFALGQSDMTHLIGQLHARNNRSAVADACGRLAFAANLRGARDHYSTGVTLRDLQFPAPAETELLAATVLPDPNNALGIAAHLQLAEMASEQKDDASAAMHYQRTVELLEAAPAELRLNLSLSFQNPGALLTGMHWHSYRLARAQADAAAMEKHLTELLRLSTDIVNMDIVLDVIPTLREAGRTDDIARLFEPLYQEYVKLVQAAPEESQYLNSLAWLCARSGEKVDEALELALRAIAQQPANYAYLDTAAEAHFRKGNFEEAVRLETEALRLQPADPFIREQLERFKAR